MPKYDLVNVHEALPLAIILLINMYHNRNKTLAHRISLFRHLLISSSCSSATLGNYGVSHFYCNNYTTKDQWKSI